MKRDEGEKDREGEGVGESYRSSRATSRIEWCPHRQVRRCAHCSTSRRLCAAQPIIIYSYLKVENVNSRYPYKYILHIRTSTLRPHMHRSVRDLLANYRMACHNRLIACHMFQKFILPPTGLLPAQTAAIRCVAGCIAAIHTTYATARFRSHCVLLSFWFMARKSLYFILSYK